MNRRPVQRPRLLPALLALPFAALTAIEGAAAANLGYRFQPDWLVLAMITTCLTFGLTGFAMTRSRHARLHGLVLGVCLIGGFIGLVALVVPSQPSRQRARAAGFVLLRRLPPFPGARTIRYRLQPIAAGDYGPSYLHPPDGYSLTRIELLPAATSPREGAAYYRRAMLRLALGASVQRPPSSVPRDPAAPILQVFSTKGPILYGVEIWRSRGHLFAEIGYS
jgi:hypothetical protein